MGSRNYVFTLNNYTPFEIEELKLYPSKYLVFGYETAPTTGTPHIQGYIEFAGVKKFDTLKKFNPRVRWETRRGTAQEASDYCKKDGNFVEIGAISKQGTRTDLNIVADAVMEKKSIREIAMEHPATFIKYSKGITALFNSQFIHRTAAPYIEWRWGLAGVGKTRYCVEAHSSSHYIKDGTMWWDGYTQQEAIIIDDFDGKWPFRDLLRLLDRYEYQGQVKGGYIPINSPYIYITCEFAPSHYWNSNELSQIERRITKIIHVSEVHVSEVVGNTNHH